MECRACANRIGAYTRRANLIENGLIGDNQVETEMMNFRRHGYRG